MSATATRPHPTTTRHVTRRHPSPEGLRVIEGGGGGGSGDGPGGPGARRGGHEDRVARSLSTSVALTTLVAVLCGIGLVMVLSASAPTSLGTYGSVWYIFHRQLFWMVAGVGVFVACTAIPYRFWQRVNRLLLIGTYGLLAAVLVNGVGVTVSGSSRWIGFGWVRIQPSEFAKLALLLFGADLLARRADKVEQARSVLVPMLGAFGVAAVLVLKQPDMGTAIVLGCITFTLLFAGGVKLKVVFRTALVCGFGACGAMLLSPYQRSRLESFLHPAANPKGSGYQVVQSLIGMNAGHLYGLGLGASREKWSLLPNAYTDFIFSVIGEEGGLIATLLVLALFLAFAWFGLRAARNAPDRFGSLLAVGVTCWVTLQAAINIGTVIGVVPVTGIPLPFISFGGSSLVITLAGAGILVNVARHEQRPGAALATTRHGPAARRDGLTGR